MLFNECMTDQPLDLGPSGAESPDASEALLERLLDIRGEMNDLEVTKLHTVVEWIATNEVDPATHEKGILCNRAVRTSGEGSPFVTEFDLMEFAAVLGMTTEGGESSVCRVAELRYRHLVLAAGSCSWAQVDRLVEEATARFACVRHRPRHPARPRRRFLFVQSGAAVSATSPSQNPQQMVLRGPRSWGLPLDDPDGVRSDP